MKNKLNYELIEFHIREAAGELDSLLNRIQFMLGRLDKAGELQVDAWGISTRPVLKCRLLTPITT